MGVVPVAPGNQDPNSEIARHLEAWNRGDRSALDSLLPLVHGELRRIAGSLMRNEPYNQTLQPTALVSDVWLRLRAHREPWSGRAHFFGAASILMRRILVEYARNRKAVRRGGDVMSVPLNGNEGAAKIDLDIDIVALDEALERLAIVDPRQARIVELRFFGGLENGEIAEILDLSLATVKREWTFARAWLHRRLRSR